MTPLALIPSAVFSFLLGAALTSSRKGLSMLPPERRSPLPGVPALAWEKFVATMVILPRTAVTPRGRMGYFGLDARRLSDVGFMRDPHKVSVCGESGVWAGEWVAPLSQERFLESSPAQYEAFSRSMRELVPDASPHVGKVVDGSRASLSGLLAVGHLAGRSGISSWVKDPSARERFKATTENFRRSNQIF
jgi:hypothetical protein